MASGDELLKFMLGAGHVRGGVVRLEASWREMLQRRSHPEPVRKLLGEMSAATALMAGSLKFDGSLILQLQGHGPLKLAVAECQPDFGLRATAKLEPDVDVSGFDFTTLAGGDARARCVLTLEPAQRQPGQQPYQGIVALTGADGQPLPDMAAVIQAYLLQSEQIPSWLLLAADEQRACGLLLQRMPGQGGKGSADAEQADLDFEQAVHLASTLTLSELLGDAPETLLRKLFWEQEVRVFDPLSPRFHCTCSRERVAGMLRLLGQHEVQSVLDEQGAIEVCCEFCGAEYRLDHVDAARLFRADVDQPPGSQLAH